MALVIIDLQGTRLCIRTTISGTIAVVAHEIISCQWRNLPDDALWIDDRNIIADEAIERMHIVEGILAVMLVKILSLSNETALVEGADSTSSIVAATDSTTCSTSSTTSMWMP